MSNIPIDEHEEVDWSLEPSVAELRRALASKATHPTEAMLGFEDLANRGSIASMLHLADMYYELRADRDRYQAAEYWYERAMKAGYFPASYMLGRLFIENDRAGDAINALTVGTGAGYPPATVRLARIHLDKSLGYYDLQKALGLLEAASRQGHIYAKRELARLYMLKGNGLKSKVRGMTLLIEACWRIFGVTLHIARYGVSRNDRRLLC